jgi:predicted alpha/beta-fold hydrolase
MQAFRPWPLLGNPHVQTVLGNLFSGNAASLAATEIQVPLPDGDHVIVHESEPARWRAGRPIALLVHGLGGSHASPYMFRVGRELLRSGIRVVRMDLRGCGAGAALARRLCSAACSEDVRAVLEHLHAQYPGAPLLLAGFSLGGAIVVKTAGEAGDRPLPGLCAVAALAPPLDLVRCSELLARQPFYDGFYVRHLTRQLRELQRLAPQLPRVRLPRRMTLRQFDDLYTAPRWGFTDADDYYRRASALPLVAKARVPAFLLTARDDPFIAVESFEAISAPHIEVHIAHGGGHLGFLGPSGQHGLRWAERQLVDWLLRHAARVSAA